MKSIYTIQIIPEGSTKIRTYHIKRIWIKIFTWILCVLAIILAVIMWKFTEINIQLVPLSCRVMPAQSPAETDSLAQIRTRVRI